jgi:hypothetical protein
LTDSIKAVSFASLDPPIKKTLTFLTILWLVSVTLLFTATDIVSGSGLFLVFLRARAVFTLLFTILLVYLYRRYSPSVIDLIRCTALPAVILGLTASMRILGPLAGLIVALFALRKKGRDALAGLAIYALIALITMYLTWPYLWPDPIGRFAESIRVMSEFPWGGTVLFNGIKYVPTDLPYSYLPVLFGLQLTEPVWVLFLCGIVLVLIKFKEERDLLLLVAIWFFLPVTAFIIMRPAMYDNFRQVLFILPPVFIMAGVVFEKIKLPVFQLTLIALVTLPGIVDGVRLHPYEYIYYNHFTGGVQGAQGKFELDYWSISYREAAEYMNASIPEKANIWVEEPAKLFAMFARSDFRIFSPASSKPARRYDYVVTNTRDDLDQTSFPDAKLVYEISRDGARLTVIKKP